MTEQEKEFDVVLYGASSFVGFYVARQLNKRAGEINAFKWAVAGRNKAKLEATLKKVGNINVPILIIEATDKAALDHMAKRTKVVASTVGPYALYGSELVAACAANGTDYCDLTAETQWVRAMIDTHQHTAKENGARIIHGCGFDSIPSDLGTFLTQQVAQARYGAPCVYVKSRLKKASGGFSGGTMHSLSQMVVSGADDQGTRQLLLNPYSLVDGKKPFQATQKDRFSFSFDRDAKEWRAPFIMATINSRVVHRTNYLLGNPWGKNFIYDEGMLTGKGPVGLVLASGATAALGSLVLLNASKLTRPVMKKVLPAPGKGPSEKSIENGFFEFSMYGKTRAGKVVQTTIRGDKDPGYGSTSKMLAETAITLAATKAGNKTAGFLTPASALGQQLISALESHAGLRFSVN